MYSPLRRNDPREILQARVESVAVFGTAEECRDVLRGLAGSLPEAVAAASSTPAALLRAADRGRIEAGRRAHLVELDDDLRVRRAMRGAGWIAGGA